MRAVALVLLAFVGSANTLYEEPPGGCAGPVDDAAFPLPRPTRRQKPPPRPPPPPPPPPPQYADADEEIAALEREMYERESMQALQGLGAEEDDWDEVERQHLRELAVRNWLKQAAAFVMLLFAAVQIYKRFANSMAKPAAAAAKEVTAPTTPTKAVKAPGDSPKPKSDATIRAPGTSNESAAPSGGSAGTATRELTGDGASEAEEETEELPAENETREPREEDDGDPQ